MSEKKPSLVSTLPTTGVVTCDLFASLAFAKADVRGILVAIVLLHKMWGMFLKGHQEET
jgi:hypothetical protein